MPLAPGSRIGAYEVTAAIGVGGMGEVYRARDSRLQRDVALKSLPQAFATDADRVARFEREARALAALNHPNIAAIYGLERDADTSAIIMELVEGDDLSARLARGPIPIDEALDIARQVARALEAAHEAGIVHRDLKPGNIKVKADGTIKVLDFGLAKALGAPGVDEPGLQGGADNSPTLTGRATHAGVILGTAAYMAPEQARGRAVDRRADVWAFGVVLYEMLTGRRAFSGDNVTEVMAAVIRDTPAIDALPAGTPAAIRRLLRRCLEKDPRRRLRDMGDAGVELDEAIAAPDQTGDARASSAGPSWTLLGAIAVLIAGAAGFAAWTLKPAPAPVRPVTRFTVTLPEGQQLTNYTMPNLAVSPDGRRLAYRTPAGIFVRGLDELEPRLVARAPGSGLWFAPDGESVLVGTTSGLSVVSVGGGPMRDVVSSGSLGGAHWTADGSIVYSTQKSIVRIPAGGGDPQEVVTAPAGEFVAWPQVLPGGTRLLFTRLGGPRGLAVIRSLDNGSEQVVLKGAGGTRYVDTGHLVYGQDGRVFAVPINLGTGALGGRPLLVPEVVYMSPQSGWVQAAISETGTMVYLSQSEGVSQSRLVLRDAKGPAVAVPTPPRVYSDIALSPDGRRAAVHLWDEDNDVWVADLVRGGLTRITFTPNEEETPLWSPDGLEVAYVATPPGEPRALFRRPADGGAAAADRKVWEAPDHFHANDWTPDGRTIIVEIRRQTSNDLLAIDVASGKETALITSPYAEGQARLSRDGRWIAYSSNESGRQEVYVQPFPALDRRVPVSTGGGGEPIWSRDGRRLYFRSPTEFMEATVLSTSPLEFSAPRALFADRYERTQGEMHTHFDVDAQGRFLLIESPQVDQAASQVAIHVVVNWAESLKMLAMGRQ